jgi:CheY-like chemotaxis protein
MLTHVAIVDDSSEFQQLVHVMLKFLGVSSISQWTNSSEALPALTAAPPDLLVLDVMMAGLSGLDVLQQLRDHSATATLPVIVCTAAINKLVEDEARLARDEYTRLLPKPFTLDELRLALNVLIPGWNA